MHPCFLPVFHKVAMVNKSLLPVRFRPPILGDCVFYTRGLKYNFELIFFWGPGVSTFACMHSYLSKFGITKESFFFFFNPALCFFFVALQALCLRMSGAWNQSTREEVTGLSWQTGWHLVFFGLGLPICCCVQSFWCGRFSTPSLVTQRSVLHLHMHILYNFGVYLAL